MSKFNYFNTITVDGYSFPPIPQANFGLNPQSFTFLNRSGHVIQYSFDGLRLHGDMNPNDSSIGLAFDGRCECKVWFRALDGYGIVRVEAWK